MLRDVSSAPFAVDILPTGVSQVVSILFLLHLIDVFQLLVHLIDVFLLCLWC